MVLVLEKNDIEKLLENFSENYSVIYYQKDKTPLSVKGYFFEPREKLFSFLGNKRKITELPKPQKKLLLFGLNFVDLEALGQLDEIMSKPKEDWFYFQNRKNSVVVGLVEHSLTVPVFFGDLVLEKINQRQYRAIVLTKHGEEIAKNKLFKKLDKPEILNYPEKKEGLRELVKDAELMADAVVWSVNHPVWDKLEKICLGCGICTYVCPICHCFSVEDKIELDDSACHRCRSWDACTLNNFALIAGGKNFRPDLKRRYYNWFFHKFVRGYKEYGKSQCVGCGRCQKYCPARIDIEKVLAEIIIDFQNKNE